MSRLKGKDRPLVPSIHMGKGRRKEGDRGEMSAPAIELTGINKSFGPVKANRDINLTVEKGTIHGIIGENGAGKSTLMSILYGFYQADSGSIRVNGAPAAINTPNDAIATGIGMVHQHFMLVQNFTVLENVMLGAEGRQMLTGAIADARAELRRLEETYALEVDTEAVIEELPVGLQQRVEILKALYRGAEILILDEPTGVLTPAEADHLFRVLAQLKEQGKTIVLITHKLREIMAITDNVSVMRQGTMVATRKTAETSVEELAELMVGRRVLLRVEKGPARPGALRLTCATHSVSDWGGSPSQNATNGAPPLTDSTKSTRKPCAPLVTTNQSSFSRGWNVTSSWFAASDFPSPSFVPSSRRTDLAARRCNSARPSAPVNVRI